VPIAVALVWTIVEILWISLTGHAGSDAVRS
jgi:hypothetical protein